MKKHVLIISHYFPPFAGGAITRVTKFVKYLPLYGWQSTVLTADKDFEEVPLDESLLKEVPANTEIYRIPSYEPVEFRKQVALKVKEKPGLKAKAYYFTRDLVSSYLLIPDRVLLWVFRAYGKAARIIQEKNIEIIFTTSPPHSLQILGLLLIKRTGKKWVTDFRDDWAGNPLFQKNRFFNKVQFFLERKVVQKADRIIVATPESRDKFLKNYPRMSPDKFVVISNG